MVGYGPWHLLDLASFVIFWGLVAVVVIFAIRYFNRRAGQPGGGQPFWQAGPQYQPPGTGPGAAEHILAERFARGEIDDQEYRQRLATLRGAATYPGPPGPMPQGPPAAGPAPGASPEPPAAP